MLTRPKIPIVCIVLMSVVVPFTWGQADLSFIKNYGQVELYTKITLVVDAIVLDRLDNGNIVETAFHRGKSMYLEGSLLPNPDELIGIMSEIFIDYHLLLQNYEFSSDEIEHIINISSKMVYFYQRGMGLGVVMGINYVN